MTEWTDGWSFPLGDRNELTPDQEASLDALRRVSRRLADATELVGLVVAARRAGLDDGRIAVASRLSIASIRRFDAQDSTDRRP